MAELQACGKGELRWAVVQRIVANKVSASKLCGTCLSANQPFPVASCTTKQLRRPICRLRLVTCPVQPDPQCLAAVAPEDPHGWGWRPKRARRHGRPRRA